MHPVLTTGSFFNINPATGMGYSLSLVSK